MNKNIEQFVNEALTQLKDVENHNVSLMKDIVKKAMSYYELKSYQKIEKTDDGQIEYLYLYSIADENLLSKVVQHAIKNESEITLEDVYQGCIIRRH